jgi:hypothetical protein
MKLPVPGEHRYAVAVEDGSDLWLTLWVKHKPNGEFFVMLPRKPFITQPHRSKKWDPHTSYHLDGVLHMKSYDRKMVTKKCQPLTAFRGTEDLGYYAGHDPKSVGVICDPADFTGIVKVGPGVLIPSYGGVKVDLVEPGQKPVRFDWTEEVIQQTFKEVAPWVVITVGSVRDCGAGFGGVIPGENMAR